MKSNGRNAAVSLENSAKENVTQCNNKYNVEEV